MLASDSDSDFEYPADGYNSDASDDCVLLGKLALGVDPQDMKAYDGKSTPQNGSQYLMKVMAEKKSVPKVVSVDTSKLSERRSGEESGAVAAGAPHPYINKFLQDLDLADETALDSFLLPSEKWRQETTSCFSLLRTKVEAWHYKVEAKEIKIKNPAKLPTNNDNTHWLKFCFGEGFMRLAAGSKEKTKEQKLSDFFVDLYDRDSINSLEQVLPCEGEKVDQSCHQDDPEEHDNQSPPADNGNETITEEKVADDPPVVPPLQVGKRPLMDVVLQLNHVQLENLVKWHLLWVQNIGFVNECQGEWLYAILASLYKPIDASVMSDLRSIVKCLIKIRSTYANDWSSYFAEVKKKQEETDHNSTCDERVFDFINTLNLFIYVIADYFKQTDLVQKIL